MKESKNTMRLLKHPARLMTRTGRSRRRKPRQWRWRLDNSRLREVQLRWSLRHIRFLCDVELRVPVIGVVELAEAWVGRAATTGVDGGRSQRAVSARPTALFARRGGRGGSGVAGGVIGGRVVVGVL